MSNEIPVQVVYQVFDSQSGAPVAEFPHDEEGAIAFASSLNVSKSCSRFSVDRGLLVGGRVF